MAIYTRTSVIFLLTACFSCVAYANERKPSPSNPVADTSIYDVTLSSQMPGTAIMTSSTAGAICQTTEVLYQVYISGCNGPYTVNYWINNEPFTGASLTSPFEFTLIVSGTTTVTLVSVSGAGCNFVLNPLQSITIYKASSPTASISPDVQVCTGSGGADLKVKFTGSGPYSFTYQANNSDFGPITTSANPYTLHVNPTTTTVYEITNVWNPSCPGSFSYQTATVTVVPPPGATLSGSSTFCNRADTSLLVDFTGTGPFELTYAIDSVLQPSITTSSDPFLLPVHTDTSQVYQLISVKTAACSVPAVGQASITVLNSPIDSNVVVYCKPEDNNYTVEFDILNAALPITFISGTGTLNGTHFTSDPIPQSLPYSFVFHDSIHCENITVAGPSVCFCVSNAGSMAIADTLEACAGEVITAVWNGGETLDGDDTLLYILHTNPGLPLGQILAWSDTSSFSFLPGMFTDTVYYISAIAGDKLGDSIDLADICLHVSNGTPILFRAYPAAALAGDLAICAGTAALLPVSFIGSAPFSLQYAMDGVPQPVIDNIFANPFDLQLNMPDTALVTLLNVTDQYCSTTAADTVLVTVNYVPQITNLQHHCDLFTTTYTVSFDIQGGLAPWTIAGNSGTLSGASFESDPIASGQPYIFTLSDDNGCGASQATDTITCPCLTNAGALDTNLIRLCPGDVANALHNSLQALDNSDTLLFVLHSNPMPTPATILASSANSSFAFDPATMQFGTTYYISALAGNIAIGVGLDWADPCLSISQSTPVVWNATPTGSLSGDFDICPGEPLSLDFVFSGQAPFSFDFTENGVLQSLTASANTYVLNTALTQSSVFLPVALQDANCPGTVSGQANVTVHPIPVMANVAQVCNPDNLHFTIDFDVLNADLATVNVTSSLAGAYNPVTGHFSSQDADLPNSYTFYVSDAWQCGQDTLVVTPDCPCVTDAGALNTALIKLCTGETAAALHDGAQVLDGNDTLLFVLHSNPTPTPATVLAASASSSFVFDPATMQFGVTYYITALAGNTAAGGGLNWADPCLSISQSTPVVWNATPTLSLSGDFDICPGEPLALNFVFTGQAPFSFDFTENGVLQSLTASANTFALNTALTQTSSFLPVAVQDANCPGTVSGQANVTVHPVPVIANVTQICNPDNLHFTVDFDVLNADLATVNVTSSLAGTYDPATGHFASQDADLPNSYTFYVSDAWQCGQDTLVATPDCPCVTDAGQLSPVPLDVCFGEDIEFPPTSGSVLDGFDELQYVLCSDPANLLQSVLLRSDTPEFGFSPLMQAGATLYIAVVAGNPLTGNPDVNDPCLSLSAAVPVLIHALPSAVIAADTTVCNGGDAVFPVMLQGEAPITFSYTLNGAPQPSITTTQNSYPISLTNIEQAQTITLLAVQDQFCSGEVTGTISVLVEQLPIISLSGSDSICPGGNALLYVGLQHSLSGNFSLHANPGGNTQINGASNGSSITVSPNQSTVYTIENVQIHDNGCPPIANGSGKVDLAPLAVTAEAGQYNGVGVSCFGAADGFAEATVTGGFGPVDLLWSTNDQASNVTDLPAGTYQVTATDAEGCTDVAEVAITEPDLLAADWATFDIDCRPGSSGELELLTVQNGTGPYTILLNNEPAIPVGALPQNISGLPAGPLEISVVDANGCVVAGTETIHLPTPLTLDLGPDQSILTGDTALISSVITGNQPVSLVWTPVESLLSPQQLSTLANPLQTTTYTLSIEDAAGCTATDDITIRIKKTRRVYIPNVIKPDGDGDNAVITVFGGAEVKQVNYLSIYDRWGEHLFIAKNFAPNDPASGWDGRWRGKDMQPGVYVYVAEVAFLDGEVLLYKGSVTVLR